MRTTLDLPDDLLKRAKISAVERGTTLRELVAAALEHELAVERAPGRLADELPQLEVREDCPLLHMTPQDLARLEEQEQAEAFVGIYRGR